MVIVEKSFPRGGVATKGEKSEGKHENIIFGALQKKLKKPKTAKAEDRADNLVDEGAQDVVETVSAELLRYDTVQDGMNIMGMVKSLDQLYLNISLPGRMTARVSALEISNAYTKVTKEFLQNAESTENYKPLTELYRVGQIVYGRVLEVQKSNPRYTSINMSLKPSELHAELQHANIKKGFIFSGAVEEVQEHGYIIESGIKGMRTFLPLEKTIAEHSVGEHIYLKVEKITQDKTSSICTCKEVKPENLKVKNQMDPILDYLLPSTIVQFNVTKHLKDGLQGTIMNECFTAYINEHQLAEPLALPEDYETNAKLYARILYVMPLTKLVYLSLNLQNNAGAESSEPLFKRGDIIEDARVHRLGTGGVILVLDNKHKGVLSYRTIKSNYKGNYDQDEVMIKYAKKTKHKVRVLDFDPMDSLYICTDDASTVNEKVFALDDLKPGDFVTATVKQRDDKIGGYMLKLSKRVSGIIEQLYLAPNAKALEEHSKVRCRVLSINTERKIAYLTNRTEYMSKQCKALASLTDAKPNAIFTGTIVKCTEDYLLVKFFNQLKGMLYKAHLGGFMASEMETFYEGQTMPFRIAKRVGEQISLTLPDDIFRLGEICPVTVVHPLDSGLEIEINHHGERHVTDEDDVIATKGLIPIRLLSDFADLLHAKLRVFTPNTEMFAVCMIKNIFSLRDVNHFQEHLTKEWRTVQPGDILKSYVKNVNGDVVEILVPIRGYAKLVKLHLKMLLVNAYQQPNIELMPEQVVFVKVLGKEHTTKTITVSAKLTDVWDGDLSSTAAYVDSYLTEIADIKKAYKKQSNPLGKYSIGDKITANFQGINAETNDWQFFVDKTKITAIVRTSIVGKSKPPKVGDAQECIILWIDYSNEVLFISNKSADLSRITKSKTLPENLVGKSGINAKILLKLDTVFICSLKKGENPLVYCPIRLHYNDFENSASIGVKEGDFCKLAFIHESKPIALPESTWKLWKDMKRKRKAIEVVVAVEAKKAKKERAEKLEKRKAVVNNSGDKLTLQVTDKKLKRKAEHNEVKAEVESKEKKKKKKAEKVAPAEPEEPAEMLFYEDKTPEKIALKEFKTKTVVKPSKTEVKTLPGITDFWSTDLTQLQQSKAAAASSDEEDAAVDADTKKTKKLSTAEKFRQQRDEETRLRAIEEKYADPTQLPESVDQFDRLVLSDPNSSKNWISYMVFHLQSTEIEKARAVARRAIKAISFRDGNEQQNIWIALLNLELRYGSKETFDETLKEALTYNEPLKIYLRTVEILSDSKKTQELIEMIGVITKKFKAEQEVWKAAASAYFSIDMPERAQQMLNKALACLPEREHVNTIVIFANLNHKHGNHEMAQTLLDQVVTSYPKRVDVWTQYVDMLVKENLIDSARAVLERAVIQKIPLKKMRTIFKKYLEFEERFGKEADVQKVKALAAEYVKNNAHL